MSSVHAVTQDARSRSPFLRASNDHKLVCYQQTDADGDQLGKRVRIVSACVLNMNRIVVREQILEERCFTVICRFVIELSGESACWAL